MPFYITGAYITGGFYTQWAGIGRKLTHHIASTNFLLLKFIEFETTVIVDSQVWSSLVTSKDGVEEELSMDTGDE